MTPSTITETLTRYVQRRQVLFEILSAAPQ